MKKIYFNPIAALLSIMILISSFSFVNSSAAAKLDWVLPGSDTYSYDVTDAYVVMRTSANLTVLSAAEKKLYDVNFDGVITVGDATLMQMHSAGIIDINSAEYQEQNPSPVPADPPEYVSAFKCGSIKAPSPQAPADGSEGSDFDADNMVAQDIYDAISELCESYPDYISAETLGKDESGEYDWNRYILSVHYFSAWQKQNYPKMYAWKNGSAVIYSPSVSPAIGETMYTTPYIGESCGTVSEVSNADRSRTVGGTKYTRDIENDVEPTLGFTKNHAANINDDLYTEEKTVLTNISVKLKDRIIGADGSVYLRYPIGDRNFDMSRKTVIVIGANEHGYPSDPREPAIITTRLLKNLCTSTGTGKTFINWLKRDCMVIACPVINPWGFSAQKGGYCNSNNVNINRNYDTPGWGGLDDAGEQGDYGGSEIETRYFMNTITESGADVAVSYHALGYSGASAANAGYVCNYQYNGIPDDTVNLKAINSFMKKKYQLKFKSYGEADPNTVAKSPSFITLAGAQGGIIEMQPVQRDAEGNASYHTAFQMEANYALMLNTLNLFVLRLNQ